MAQYVVHKIGFWYTDECFAVGEERGTVMGITRSLEEAQAIKKREDIKSIKNVGGFESEDFLFDHPNRESINQKLEEYITSEFKTTEEGNYSTYLLPKGITDEQAARFLSILELSFHNIVQYGDDEVIDATAFGFDQYEGEISGF
jgi:hypothetical protein